MKLVACQCYLHYNVYVTVDNCNSQPLQIKSKESDRHIRAVKSDKKGKQISIAVCLVTFSSWEQ